MRLHDRIQNRLSGEFDTVRRRRAEPREVGPYRVVDDVNLRQFLDDEYPVTTARVEIGFQLRRGTQEYYWLNWMEPARRLLVGWHQDDTHDDHGLVHLQVNDDVDHQPHSLSTRNLSMSSNAGSRQPDAVTAVE